MSLFRDQKTYWDRVSEDKQFSTPFQINAFAQYVSKEMKILDVGCGYGRTLNELYERGFVNLTGVDISQGMIDRGRRMHPHLNLIKNRREILPFPDKTFHAVILIAVLTCIPETGEQLKLLSEIRRVLKDNGILYLNDFLLNRDRRNLRRYERFRDKYGDYGVFELQEGAVMRHHTREHIFELTKCFDKLVFKHVQYTTMNGNKSNGFYYIGRKKQC